MEAECANRGQRLEGKTIAAHAAADMPPSLMPTQAMAGPLAAVFLSGAFQEQAAPGFPLPP